MAVKMAVKVEALPVAPAVVVVAMAAAMAGAAQVRQRGAMLGAARRVAVATMVAEMAELVVPEAWAASGSMMDAWSPTASA